MPTGFDTTRDTTAQAGTIKSLAYDFVARYLSQSHWKSVTPSETTALAAAGLNLVLVYEDDPTDAGYFSYDRGQADATRAAQQADLLAAPPGTALYFAVDYDAAANDITGVITQYFTGIADALTAHAANNTAYNAGVYGSGATCAAITAAGLAQYSWLAQSTGWAGHATYSTWSIRQHMPATIAGLPADPNDAIETYGAILATPLLV